MMPNKSYVVTELMAEDEEIDCQFCDKLAFYLIDRRVPVCENHIFAGIKTV